MVVVGGIEHRKALAELIQYKGDSVNYGCQ
jgi:hypothetical protein